MKSVVVDVSAYDWEGDRPLERPFAETVIYEAHVKGFTAHPSSGLDDARRGTYAGFIEKIPYLVDLGITAVELLPVFAFDAEDAPGDRPNYWGYQPVSFFAPHGAYASRPGAQGAVDEFRDLVKALHRAGLEVILDVVYNHTAEGGEGGPTFCYRGLANEQYYLLDRDDRSNYADFSGTGNTLNANEPIVRRMILDSLRYWVAEMHVDGFRFDLASVLSRDEDGAPVPRPPVIWDIETDPVLAGTKLIAEAWDAAGLYQVGSFAGDRWVEWNGRFRDDVRSFVKSDPGKTWAVAQRMTGSPDIYGHLDREPQKTINFITCHDGFTLNDVVSYDRKHNEANGEENRDGNDANLSWNGGVEGPSDDPAIEALRERQIKNLLTIELLSVGVPMLTMGDEIRRTQLGNNNAYCQDSELSWFDWSAVERHADLLRFCGGLIAARRAARALLDTPVDVTLAELIKRSRVELHGTRLGKPDTGDTSRSIAIAFWGEHLVLHLILNAYWEPLTFELPAPAGHLAWHRVVDTTLPSPDDLASAVDAAVVDADTYTAGPRSVVVLAARRTADRVRAAAARGRGVTTGPDLGGMERERMEHPGHLEEGLDSASPWYQWGPYVSERAWGSVREDYSADGDAWSSFPHDHARSRAYRWNEDGMAGISDVFGRLNLGLALWNGKDPILKERMFGLTNGEGNHGEDVKEYWWYLDAVPSSAWLRWRYHYPQAAYPYRRLIDENARRSKLEPEFELLDTGIFDDDRYWIVEVEYGKADPTDILARITVRNVGPGGGRAPRPADDLVPQRVVVGPGGRPAAALGVTRRVVAPRQPPGPRRLRPPRRGGAGRHAAAAAVLRERDQRGPHLRAAADDAVPQGRHQRPRRGRRGDRQPRRNRLEGRRLVPGHGPAGRDRGAAPAPAAPAAERRPGGGATASTSWAPRSTRRWRSDSRRPTTSTPTCAGPGRPTTRR